MIYTAPVETARTYYNSRDADAFYFRVWGGEDIHIGLYESDDEAIAAASRRTVEYLASKLDELGPGRKVIDLGSGFGGASRYLASTYGCHVTAINLSDVENQRHRTMNQDRGLDDKIDVVDASFDALPVEDNRFYAAWSQDAILHSDNRPQVIKEVARILEPGGYFVFTDPMQSDDCPDGVLQPILDRIHLDSLASPAFYRQIAEQVGLEFVEFEDYTPQLIRHYSRVLEETAHHEIELAGSIDPEYLANMKRGLQHWIDGGRNGWLSWGVFLVRKPA